MGDAVPHDEEGRQPTLVFGPFCLQYCPQQLARAGEAVRLGGRALELLCALAERAGEVLSRAELEARVWPHSIVEDSSLRVHIGALRKALGDGVDGARYIANVPGRGYSFVAPVRRLPADAPDARTHDGRALVGAARFADADASASASAHAYANDYASEHVDGHAEADAAGGAQRARAAPNNLPARLASLLGRDAAIAALAAQLAPHRLVSIVGHGGMGKTVLALAVAARVQADYPDGVCFVDLAGLEVAAHVPDALATALGLSIASEQTLPGLDAFLRPRRMLLVMDNCEHLIDAVAALVDRLLRGAARLDVLATSREPLDAGGEWVHRLAPLATPPPDVKLDLRAALAYPALQLLVERATASVDSFVLDDDNVAIAGALCRRLDGVPLAIEFAAARVGLLGLHGVDAQLDDRLRLLGSGRRTVLPRHRTLRALIDWSYALLPEAEQCVLRRCAVFTGGFTLASASAVLAGQGLPDERVRDAVLALASKSLVRAELGAGEPYYSLLGITRAYALDKLADDSCVAALRQRHARQMVVLMQQGERDWDSTPFATWLATYARSVGNLRAALDWAFGDDGDAALGVTLTAAILLTTAQFIGEDELRARGSQAIAAIERGVVIAPALEMRIRSVQTQIGLPNAATRAAAAPCYQLALAQAVRDENADDEIEVHFYLGARCYGNGDYRGASIHAAQALAVARRSGVAASIIHCERIGAQAQHFLGQHDVALAMAGRVLARAGERVPLRFASPVDRRVSMRIVSARILWLQGKGAQAAALASEAVDIAAGGHFPTSLAQAISFAAAPIALWRGDDDLAARYVGQLAEHTAHHKLRYWQGWVDQLRQVLALRAAPASALAGLRGDADPKQADHLCTFGAWAYAAQVQARCAEGLVGWCAPEALRVQGELLRLAGDGAGGGAAERALRASLALAEAQHTPAWALRSATSLGQLLLERADCGGARALLAHHLAAMDDDGDSADARRARSLLAQAR